MHFDLRVTDLDRGRVDRRGRRVGGGRRRSRPRRGGGTAVGVNGERERET